MLYSQASFLIYSKRVKGVVAQGTQGADGVFVADQVLAKHDENYMPPEAADALEKAQQYNANKAAGEDK